MLGQSVQGNIAKAIKERKRIGNNLLNLAEEDVEPRKIVTRLAHALGTMRSRASIYKTFVNDDGSAFSVRVSNHRANFKNYADKNNYADTHLSLAFVRERPGKFVPDSRIELREFEYKEAELTVENVKDIILSLQRSLENRGEFVDTTGLAKLNESRKTGEADIHEKNLNYKVNAETAEYDDVVARYTNPDGTKKAGWLKAPNGKKSNLTERQWVQVRTPAFKKWFGDWEAAAEVYSVVGVKAAPFNRVDSAIHWAKSNGIIGLMPNEETGGKGEINISVGSIREMLNPHQREKSVSIGAHFAALTKLRDIIRESRMIESHPDYKKGDDGKRSKENGSNPNVEIGVLYGAISFNGEIYRVKTTLKRYEDKNRKAKAYAYSVSEIEVLAGTSDGLQEESIPNANTSISGNKLLQGVLDVNGNLVLNYSEVVDENGEPLVVYHGTDAEFTEFDTDEESDKRQGHAWMADYPDGTIFLASDKESAKYYGKNVMPLFVRLFNPQRVRVRKGESLVKPIDDEGLAYYGDVIVSDGEHVVIATNYNRAVKSATDNIGTFDGGNADIRYRMAEMADNAPYGVRVATLGSALRNGAYDALVNYQGPLFRAYRAITKGKIVDDEHNVEAAAKNVHGKIRHKIETVEHRYIEPLMDIIEKYKLDVDKLDEYLYAKFAPERNAMVAARTAVVDPETGDLCRTARHYRYFQPRTD